MEKYHLGVGVEKNTLKRRPCTFGRSLWYTNCPVNFSFFWSTKKNLVDQKKFWYSKKKFWYTKMKFGRSKKKIWSTKKIFSIPKKNLVDQKNEKLTGQLVYQRD